MSICLLAFSMNAWGQQAQSVKSKGETLKKDFQLEDLYSSAQIDRLEIEAPAKLQEIKAFFEIWNQLSESRKSDLVKIDMYRLYIRNREQFDLKIAQQHP